MEAAPFIALPSPRTVAIPWLPDVLRAFYNTHEGIGLDADVDNPIRLGRADELVRVRLDELDMFRGYEPEGPWASFSGIRLGISCFFDNIVFVLHAPVCDPGAILAFGPDVPGPGGRGDDADIPGSLVLARDLDSWLGRIREDHWHEYGLVPGEIDDLPEARAAFLRRHFLDLNPKIDWART